MTHTTTVTRREALMLSAGAMVVGVMAGCANDKEAEKPTITSGVVSIGSAADYPAGTVSTKLLKKYGIAIANDSGTVLAIRPVCTHKGCMTAWKPEINQFECPCHHSHFDILGRPLGGPAKTAMKATPATVGAGGQLMVDLGLVQVEKPAAGDDKP